MKMLAILMIAGNLTSRRLKLKISTSPYNNPCNVFACMLATLWKGNSCHITRLKTEVVLMSLSMLLRKPVLIGLTHLSCAASCCLDQQGFDTFDLHNVRRALAYACRV